MSSSAIGSSRSSQKNSTSKLPSVLHQIKQKSLSKSNLSSSDSRIDHKQNLDYVNPLFNVPQIENQMQTVLDFSDYSVSKRQVVQKYQKLLRLSEDTPIVEQRRQYVTLLKRNLAQSIIVAMKCHERIRSIHSQLQNNDYLMHELKRLQKLLVKQILV